MNFISIIEAKRDGKVLSTEQIQEVITHYTRGDIPDYQMSALLMAICLRGCNEKETAALTNAMRYSGETLTFPKDHRPLVDKHSTGGIGDKVSLPLVPLLAALGFRVPMISGRGLGITGGTLDKLDSIPGFQSTLSKERIIEIVQTVGGVICGQTENMVPADKKIYALRDVSGTVPSIPLVAASILSKKLASGTESLVLDVKFGSGAFMKSKAQALELARTMTLLGNNCGLKTKALLSRMDVPLGYAVGHWLEIRETVEFLKNHRLAEPDLFDLVIDCAAHLLVMTGKAGDLASGRSQAHACLATGAPLKKWEEMLTAQGADLEALEKKMNLITSECEVMEIRAEREGFLKACDARVIGEAMHELGAGRLTKEASIDHQVGIDALVRPGSRIQTGDLLARVHHRRHRNSHAALERIRKSFAVAEDQFHKEPIIDSVID